MAYSFWIMFNYVRPPMMTTQMLWLIGPDQSWLFGGQSQTISTRLANVFVKMQVFDIIINTTRVDHCKYLQLTKLVKLQGKVVRHFSILHGGGF
jgi:hypothetical protein